MRSLIVAATSLMAGFLLGQAYSQQKQPAPLPSPPKKPEATPEGYTAYQFRCRLCDGVTKFACKPQASERSFSLDCCRCGIENSVKVKPSVQHT